jgi:hypothetical protein
VFFFTRNGYLSEIKRLQIANNDLQEANFKQQDINKGLIDRILALTDPVALRESRREIKEVKPGNGLVPQSLNERSRQPRRAYREPISKVRPPLRINWDKETEPAREAVGRVISASLEEGN